MDAKTYLTKKSFCVLPWTGLFIQPNGVVKNCSINSTELGNINDTALPLILHNTVNQQIKSDMLNDVIHHRCDRCYNFEANQQNIDQIGNRFWYLKKLKNTDRSLYDSTENFQLKMLDLRWKNTCNFACVFCGPDLSSRWATELNQPQRIDSVSLKESIEYVYDNLHTVEHIYLAGGEPLLIAENLILLKKMLQINPAINLRINTNLSIVNNEIYNTIKQFTNVHWTVSIDSVGEEFEYIRYGSSWDTFTKNLSILNRDFPEKINFNFVWCILNSNSIHLAIDYLLNQGYHENTIIVNPLDDPSWYDIRNLPEETLVDLRFNLKLKIEQTDPHYCLNKSLLMMLNYIQPSSFIKDVSSTLSNLKTLDLRRGLDSRKIFPGLYLCLE
jgi:MoaA/NifB/PqqE/SkfB family radical SAM enzyme